MSNVIVAGGGASGLTAAIFAARGGNSVTILEHNERVGKKLLMTGNGKCNLTNMSGFRGKYYSSGEESLDKIYGALDAFGAEETRAFFEKMGLYTKEKRDGGVYPVSEQASTVLDVLRSECARLGVKTVTSCKIHDVKPHKNGGIVTALNIRETGKNKCVEFKYGKLILATGGKAAPASGADGSGYRIAQAIGHSVVKPLPALVQLKCGGDFFKSVSGVRVQAGVALYIDGKKAAYDEGELQLTDYGISGIPVFQISRIAARALDDKNKCTAAINFLTYICENERDLFVSKGTDAKLYGYKSVTELLSGMAHKKVAQMICRKNGLRTETTVAEAGVEKVRSCIMELFDFRVEVTGTNAFENAQICSGGVPLGEVDENFESKICKDVYIVGELLDCDGICGGYNLQWAWATGAIAGRSII